MEESVLKSNEKKISKNKKDEVEKINEQQRFQLVVDKLNAAVFEWNQKTGDFYFSEAYKKYALSSVNADDILKNKGPRDLVFKEDWPEVLKFFKCTTSGKSQVECTIRLKMTDGTFRWCKMIGLFYKDKNNSAEKVIGIIIDVNEEHEKSFMLNKVLNQIPGGVAIFEVSKEAKCTYFNEGFAELSNRTHEELEKIIKQGKLFETVIPTSDLKQFNKIIDSQIKSNRTINFICRFLKKNEEVSWVHVSADRLRYEKGTYVYYCIFTKPTEESYLYQRMIDDSAIGVFVAEKKVTGLYM